MKSEPTIPLPHLATVFQPAAVSARDPRWRWLVLATWVLFAVAVGGKAIIAPRKHTTFPAFVAGTNCWWAEQNPYDTRICPHDFRYGPPFAVLFTPFALVPRWLGGSLWGLFNVGVLFWSLRVVTRRVLPLSWTTRREAVFLLLVSLTAARGLWAGQTNTLIMSLLLGAAAAIVERRWWLAATLMAAPVYIKVWPVAAALLLVACWPRQLVGRFLVTMAGIGCLPFVVKNGSWVATSYAHWRAALLGPMQTRHDYRDVWTIWEQFHPVHPQAYLALQLCSALIVFAACLWIRRRSGSVPHTLTVVLGLWASWQLLLGPGTERNTISLIAPFTSWGLIAAHTERRRWGWMLSAFILVTTFTFGLFERSVQNHFPAIVTALPFGVLAYMTWLLSYGWDCCRQAVSEAVPLRIVSADDAPEALPLAGTSESGPLRKAA